MKTIRGYSIIFILLAASLVGFAQTTHRWDDKPLEQVREAAERKDAGAMFRMYEIHQEGFGVKPDRVAAERWLTKSAEAGNSSAQYILAQLLESPRRGSGNRVGDAPASMAEAIKWYRRAAANGILDAQYELADCHFWGNGLEQDEAAGLELMRATADAGFPRAQLRLAELYARGIGEPRNANDTPDAILQRMVTNRVVADFDAVGTAYRTIVTRYVRGIGKPKDLITAVDWYCRVADANLISHWGLQTRMNYVAPPPQSVPSIGLRGCPGRSVSLEIPEEWDVDTSFLRVLSLYLKSTRNNDAESPLQIAELYLQGDDVPASPTRAWMWLKLATERGSAAAKAKLALRENKMAAKELEAARAELPRLSARLREVATLLGKE